MVTAEQARLRNRRRSRRSNARTTVKLQCRNGALGLGPNLAIRVLDVSDTGARLIVSKPLEPNSEVEIIIDGHNLSGVIKRIGVVRWLVTLDNGQFCIGIEFQKHLTYRDWQALVVPN